jgi:hypothetical protein
MTWYNAILLTIAVFASVGAVFFVPILLCGLFDKMLEGCRRKKHPEYFKYWDEALKLSFERGAEYNRRKQRFDYYFKLYTDGLRDGECTYEYYSDRMTKRMEEYKELCDWFQEEEKRIKELLIKADLYAKEHNLCWGVIYDSKSK